MNARSFSLLVEGSTFRATDRAIQKNARRSRITHRECRVLFLRFARRLKLIEIAKKLQITLAAVRNRIYRACRRCPQIAVVFPPQNRGNRSNQRKLAHA
jgi:DNA-directed RNA polymerase specialized sigma subunit